MISRIVSLVVLAEEELSEHQSTRLGKHAVGECDEAPVPEAVLFEVERSEVLKLSKAW